MWICSLVKLKPTIDIKYALESLQNLVNVLSDRGCEKVVIGGDFNCRIGQEGNNYSSEFFENTNLLPIRQSEDAVFNFRGSHLLEFMADNHFVLLNGRCAGDQPARFTYAGVRGSSVIDLVWVKGTDMSLVKDMFVSDTVSHSYHFQVALELTNPRVVFPSSRGKIRDELRLRWNPETESNYKQAMMWSTRVTLPDDINTMYTEFMGAVYEVAGNLSLIKVSRQLPASFRTTRKPWFDGECVAAKRKVRRTLTRFRNRSRSAEVRGVYISAKKAYRRLLARKKKAYNDRLMNELSLCTDQVTFWQVVNRYRRRTHGCPSGSITMDEWETHFAELYSGRVGLEITLHDAADPFLCSEIELSEVQCAVEQCKNNKSPGSDGVPFEFYKYLPENWLYYICSMFNRIMSLEVLPRAWSDVLLVMLHKKGDASNPMNYRGIALMNCFAKIFTSVLLVRLEKWSEKYNIIPEAQSGFRKNRSCMDNIFTLSSLIQIHLRLKGRKLFAAFVDFRRAFDSVDHNILWMKLYRLGISGKFIRVIRELYNNATAQIKYDRVVSETRFKLDRGILQGESLSPLLFSLFISDMEAFFRQKGISGLAIDGSHDVILLLYADDLVILSDSPSDLNRKLKLLSEYSLKNKLEVNRDKTKVMCFQRGGNNLRYGSSFFYNSEPLEVVNKYYYLGIPLTSSGVLLEAAKHCVNKSKIAVNSALGLICRTKISSWEQRFLLFRSVVVSTLMYAAPLWGLNYPELAERVQVYFVKKMLSLTRTTPDYVVRCETGLVHTSLTILKHTLRWLIKVLEMGEERYPRLCLDRLRCLLGRTSFRGARNNWLVKLEGVLRELGFDLGVSDVDVVFLKTNFKLIMDKYRAFLISSDVSRLRISIYADLFPNLLCAPSLVDYGPQNYLRINLPVYMAKFIAQLRTCNYKKYVSFFIKGFNYVISVGELCSVCNMHEVETLEHLFFVCPLYCRVRERFGTLGVSGMEDLRRHLTQVDRSNSQIIYATVLEMLRLRAFLRNEW